MVDEGQYALSLVLSLNRDATRLGPLIGGGWFGRKRDPGMRVGYLIRADDLVVARGTTDDWSSGSISFKGDGTAVVHRLFLERTQRLVVEVVVEMAVEGLRSVLTRAKLDRVAEFEKEPVVAQLRVTLVRVFGLLGAAAFVLTGTLLARSRKKP